MVYQYTEPRAPIDADYHSPGPVYALPGLTGRYGHDTTKEAGPAWSLKGRDKGKTKSRGPGPVYNIDGVYRDGPDGTPRYTIKGRLDRLSSHQTPGPGAYSSQTLGPTAEKGIGPSYSFGLKPEKDHKADIPGPGSYSPRGKGTKDERNQPAYSFGVRHKNQNYQGSPGPAAYYPAQDGKKRSPAYSIKGREGDNYDTQGPGPGAYDTLDMVQKKSPAYSFGVRHRAYMKEDIPGPGAYQIDEGRGGKGVSIKGRTKGANTDHSPGPAAYHPDSKLLRHGHDGGRQVTIKSRVDKLSSHQNPGPGAYSPHVLGPTAESHGPAYSFGGRSEKQIDEAAPGPGHYYPEPSRGAPAYSFGMRRHAPDNSGQPGPADYMVKPKVYNTGVAPGPQYSIQGKNDPEYSHLQPGPGDYNPAYPERPQGDGYTFGIKHKSRNKVVMGDTRNTGKAQAVNRDSRQYVSTGHQ